MPSIRCFLVTPFPLIALSLRRYASASVCPVGPNSYHNAEVGIGEVPEVLDAEGNLPSHPQPPHDDPRWPTHCACGYAFAPEDTWQVFQDSVYGTEEQRWTYRDLPVGAMFYAPWLQPKEAEEYTKGWLCPTDNSVLTVIIPRNPDGSGRWEWIVDQYCANCTRRGEPHHCWCRHGTAPDITVDKTPPDALGTCSAGAGSIWSDYPTGWHGFLKNGFLVQA